MGRITLAQGSWILFDFANSIFFVNVISVYFPIYFVEELGGSALMLALAFGGAQILTGISAIYWGTLADRGQRYRQLFVTFALLTFGLALLLPLFQPPLLLVVFLLGFYVYATTGLFYDALLPGIANRDNLPRVIGLGGGIGLMGNLLALVLVAPVLSAFGTGAVFVATGVAYVLLALPAIVFVRPKAAPARLELLKTLARPESWLKRFLLARVLYGGALVALIINIPLMGRQLFALDDGQIRLFYFIASLAAAAGAILAGFIAKRIHPLKLVVGGLAVWALLGLAAASLVPTVLYAAAPAIGFFAGIAMSADRIFFIRGVSGKKLGQYLGLHRLAFLTGGILVPISFGAVLSWLAADKQLAYHVALIGVGTLLAASVIILRPLLRKA